MKRCWKIFNRFIQSTSLPCLAEFFATGFGFRRKLKQRYRA